VSEVAQGSISLLLRSVGERLADLVDDAPLLLRFAGPDEISHEPPHPRGN
jgi:hypothetical protein